MSTFEVGQTVYWVTSYGVELSGEWQDEKFFWKTFSSPLEAWENFLSAEVLPRQAHHERELRHWLPLNDRSRERIAELRGVDRADAHPNISPDGSFQGGTDADREAL